MYLKMKEVRIVEVRVYDVGEGFSVEVSPMVPKQEEDGWYDYWLSHESYGVKDYMFGIKCDVDSIEDYIWSNVAGYIESYEEEYFDY